MSPPSLRLHHATRDDAPGLLKLIVALAEFEELPPPDAEAQSRLVADAFGLVPAFEAWLASVDGREEPVAYAILFKTYSTFLARPTLYLEDLFVLPEYRKQGIGGALLRKTVELAHERGCGRVEWTALDWNVNAQKVYEEKVGARRMSEWYLYRMVREDMERYLADGV